MALKDYNLLVECLMNIFTVDNGILKILLIRKKDEPYKGYWILPNNLIKKDETIEDTVTNTIYDKLGIKSLYIEQSHTYSNVDRYPDERVIGVNYIGLIDSITLLLKRENRDNIESEWFPVDDLPKLGYDHKEIIDRTLTILGKKLSNVSYIRNLFPSDFTLPEIEKALDKVFSRNVDRRNFRKKLLKLNVIEETGDKSEGGSGRPAKMYRFKDSIKDINIF